MSGLRRRLTEDADGDDPLLSVVNLIDVFLVLVAALLLAVAKNPLNPFTDERVTVIRNPGTSGMEVVVKEGRKIEHFRGDGASQSAAGGVRAGSAYRMPDGGLVYVPE
ncbi:DUF2149 domain-containing protein [Zoogloea sp.]|uniref:DUF2149 domain-containing protein n=1 Tax=Zoogloea sp. TaxID=49181 RepID=UPI0035B3E2C7